MVDSKSSRRCFRRLRSNRRSSKREEEGIKRVQKEKLGNMRKVERARTVRWGMAKRGMKWNGEERRGGRERWTARHDAAHGETESNSRPAGAVLSAPAASCHCHQQYAPYTSSPLFRLPSSPTSAPMPVLVIPIPILRRHDFYHQPIITIVDNNLICVEYFL